MSNTYQYLCQRKQDLEKTIIEAQLKAQAPFDEELSALNLALEALERGGLSKGEIGAEESSFAPTGRRGRKARSTLEMVAMVLERSGRPVSVSDISRQLIHRWARQTPLAAVLAELRALERLGRARRRGEGWAAVAEAAAPGAAATERDEAALGA